MVSLVNKLLYPMDLKRYMVLSFATLWTLALIMALITTIVHQINFQDSSTEINLKHKIKELSSDIIVLETDLQNQNIKILELKENFTRINEWWYYP